MIKKLVIRYVQSPYSGLAFWQVVEKKTTVKLPRYDGSDEQEVVIFTLQEECDDE